MNILILSGSPRKGGNTDLLVEAFVKGASQKHHVEVVSVHDYKVNPCMGCNACFKNETHACVQKDDMPLIYEKMAIADMLVIASPVYFYSICAQLKALIDRTVVVYPNLTNKKFYFILTMADTNRKMFEGSLAALRGFLECYEGSKECGMVCASGVYEKGTVKDKKFMAAARKLGAKVK
jgi:multimeric flavodoxin WrbA